MPTAPSASTGPHSGMGFVQFVCLIAALMATAITAGFLLIKTNLLSVLTEISSSLVLTP